MADEWDMPEPSENFEDRYADELEMLDELEDDFDAPSSKRCLNFESEKKTSISECSEPKKSSQGEIPKKRDCDDFYDTLPADDSDKEVEDVLTEIYGPKKKKARLSPINPMNSTKQNGISVVNDIPEDFLDTLEEPNFSFSSSQWSPQQTSANQTTSARKQIKVLTRAPVTQDFVAVTRSDGQRLYMGLDPDGEKHKDKQLGTSKKKSGIRSLQLLSVPFSVLRQHVEDQRRNKLLEESEQITASLRRALEEDLDTVDDIDTDIHSHMVDDRNGEPTAALWVDRYAPKHFTELLSDDCINRNLLKWLKLWDRVVFHKNQKLRLTAAQKQKQKENQQNPNKKQPFKASLDDDTEWNELDNAGRPVKKISLLCGPPGLGKTTLAHVIAKHAGYNVVEMNASDDRSVDVFRNKIESATQMKSVLGKDERPNCLVIDEIDGAPTPAINALLSLIKQKGDSDGGLKKSKKKKKVEPLSRPIICICNDQFVPSLRPLRQCALVTVFPTTVPGRLASRLLEVTKKEEVKTDMSTLLALCEKADSDIRSCLNTLQFVHKRHGGQVSLQHIQSADVGQKDAHKSLFSIWQEIFQLPKPKRRRFAVPVTEQPRLDSGGFLPLADINGQHAAAAPTGMSAMASRFHNVLHSAISNGQFDKVAQGLFENYLQVKFKDPSLQLVVAGTEWLEFSDFIQEAVSHHQSFMLKRFSPFLSVAFHMMYASASHTKLSYPSSQYECRLRETRTMNLMNSIVSESSPCVRRNLNARVSFLELFPLLLEIITPNMRPVNTQLFSAREKQQLAELIDTMIRYNVTYHQERNFDGQYTYVLDPNMEEAVKFPGLPQHKQLTYATKQLIAREIQLEKMRRTEAAMKEHFQSSSAATGNGENSQPNKKKAVVVLKHDVREPKVNREKPVVDFFGRVVKPNTTNDRMEGKNAVKKETHTLKSLIWFRFNEGFSNAVRKNIKIQEFL